MNFIRLLKSEAISLVRKDNKKLEVGVFKADEGIVFFDNSPIEEVLDLPVLPPAPPEEDIPNQETLAAIDETNTQELESFETVSDLMEDLEKDEELPPLTDEVHKGKRGRPSKKK